MHVKKILSLTALVMLLCASAALAADAKTALGFHSYSAPVGIRTWFSPQLGLDVGVGFDSQTNTHDSPAVDDKFSGYSVEAGLPYVFKSWDKVKFIGRPGVIYGTSKQEPSGGTSVKNTNLIVTGELEVELTVAENVTISMSHGLDYFSGHDDRTPENKRSGFETLGNGWSSLGFHVYLW
jgi:hypothetical protein